MNKIQQMIVKTLAKMLLNEKQEISLMKLGGNLAAVCTVVLGLPDMGYHVSVDIINGAKVLLSLCVALGVAGARDAMKK